MNSLPMLKSFALTALLAALLAGCSTSQPATADKNEIRKSLRPIVGTRLINAKGATPTDQEKIDDTAAGLCGAGVWTQSECVRHGQESREGAR